MRTHETETYGEIVFDDLSELVQYVRKPGRDAEEYIDCFVNSGTRTNGGVNTRAKLNDLLANGDEAAAARAMEVATDTLASVEREFDIEGWHSRYDVAGADVDVARYLSGEPENMITFDLIATPRVGRVITLLVGVTASSGVGAAKIRERGEALAALVFAIEHIGFRTEVWADCQVDPPGGWGLSGWGTPSSQRKSARLLVKVKDAADTLDPATIMGTLAHAAFFRGACMPAFHLFSTRVQSDIGVGDAYGRPRGDGESMVTELQPPEGVTIRTDMLSSTEWNGDAGEFVVDKLKELGIIND